MIESQWFQRQADGGWIWRYPLFGYGINPFYIPKNLRRIFYSIDVDGLNYFVRHLKKIVDFDYGEDVVIYLHCNAGKDRTGEAAACYLMQHKGYTFKQAMLLNQKIAKRKLRWMSVNAIRWYAFFLQECVHVPTIGEIN